MSGFGSGIALPLTVDLTGVDAAFAQMLQKYQAARGELAKPIPVSVQEGGSATFGMSPNARSAAGVSNDAWRSIASEENRKFGATYERGVRARRAIDAEEEAAQIARAKESFPDTGGGDQGSKFGRRALAILATHEIIAGLQGLQSGSNQLSLSGSLEQQLSARMASLKGGSALVGGGSALALAGLGVGFMPAAIAGLAIQGIGDLYAGGVQGGLEGQLAVYRSQQALGLSQVGLQGSASVAIASTAMDKSRASIEARFANEHIKLNQSMADIAKENADAGPVSSIFGPAGEKTAILGQQARRNRMLALMNQQSQLGIQEQTELTDLNAQRYEQAESMISSRMGMREAAAGTGNRASVLYRANIEEAGLRTKIGAAANGYANDVMAEFDKQISDRASTMIGGVIASGLQLRGDTVRAAIVRSSYALMTMDQTNPMYAPTAAAGNINIAIAQHEQDQKVAALQTQSAVANTGDPVHAALLGIAGNFRTATMDMDQTNPVFLEQKSLAQAQIQQLSRERWETTSKLDLNLGNRARVLRDTIEHPRNAIFSDIDAMLGAGEEDIQSLNQAGYKDQADKARGNLLLALKASRSKWINSFEGVSLGWNEIDKAFASNTSEDVGAIVAKYASAAKEAGGFVGQNGPPTQVKIDKADFAEFGKAVADALSQFLSN